MYSTAIKRSTNGLPMGVATLPIPESSSSGSPQPSPPFFALCGAEDDGEDDPGV